MRQRFSLRKSFVVPNEIVVFGQKKRVVVVYDDKKSLSVEQSDDSVTFYVKERATKRFVAVFVDAWYLKQAVDFARNVINSMKREGVSVAIDVYSGTYHSTALARSRTMSSDMRIIITRGLLLLSEEKARAQVASTYENICRTLASRR